MCNGKLAEVQKVLAVTLLLNLSVALTKITLGAVLGVMAVVADGLHSLGDTMSNIVGIIGVRLARRKPDQTHGYGYERFEAVATLMIVSLIVVTCYKVFESGFIRLFKPQAIAGSPILAGVMLASMAVNVLTVRYEGRAGKRLGSQLLVADSTETKTDLMVSAGVILTTFLAGITGWYWLDGAVTLGIGFLIIRVIIEVIKPTAQELSDAQAIEPKIVKETVMAIDGVRFCHAIRSRGTPDGFFLDMHLGVDRQLTIEEAHDDICHRVKVELHRVFPGLKSAMVHLEPDNDSGRRRGRSIFRDRDEYDPDGKG
ncbi:MAG: cation diffusion facilitator family transporter [Acidobacteriaceae bacterium]